MDKREQVEFILYVLGCNLKAFLRTWVQSLRTWVQSLRTWVQFIFSKHPSKLMIAHVSK
jgi:hypothetical protein